MSQIVTFTMVGYEAVTRCSDEDALTIVDKLRVCWTDQTAAMITVTDSREGGSPMHLNTAHVQAVRLTEVAS